MQLPAGSIALHDGSSSTAWGYAGLELSGYLLYDLNDTIPTYLLGFNL
ncbi:hypothetical protein ACTHRH_06480 [Paenibacillus sp. SAFN-117]